MPKAVLQLVLTTTWEGDGTEEEIREEAGQLLEEYLTHKEFPLMDDYGKGAWGGYDGPFLIKSRVQIEHKQNTDPLQTL